MSYTLCIDMDSVIVDLMSEWFSRYNRDYSDFITVEDAVDWDATRYVKSTCGSKIYDYLNEPGMFAELKPLSDAVDVLSRLNEKYNIFLVTSPFSRYSYQEKEEWVERYLPFLGRERIIFTHRKDLIKADLYFDDAPHHLVRYKENGLLAVAMDYPYNRSVSCLREGDSITR
ncbi:putative 5'(3')-deoxyribonucleotidase [compost metagenome]